MSLNRRSLLKRVCEATAASKLATVTPNRKSQSQTSDEPARQKVSKRPIGVTYYLHSSPVSVPLESFATVQSDIQNLLTAGKWTTKSLTPFETSNDQRIDYLSSGDQYHRIDIHTGREVSVKRYQLTAHRTETNDVSTTISQATRFERDAVAKAVLSAERGTTDTIVAHLVPPDENGYLGTIAQQEIIDRTGSSVIQYQGEQYRIETSVTVSDEPVFEHTTEESITEDEYKDRIEDAKSPTRVDTSELSNAATAIFEQSVEGYSERPIITYPFESTNTVSAEFEALASQLGFSLHSEMNDGRTVRFDGKYYNAHCFGRGC